MNQLIFDHLENLNLIPKSFPLKNNLINPLMNSIEDKYLNILKRKFSIKELDIKLFMSKLLNIICNQLITNSTKEIYLKKYSDNQVILNTLEDLGYYLIKSSNNEAIKTKWNLSITLKKNLKISLK